MLFHSVMCLGVETKTVHWCKLTTLCNSPRRYIWFGSEWVWAQGPPRYKGTIFLGIEISIIKIRRSDDRVVCVMGIPLSRKMVFILRRVPGPLTQCIPRSWHRDTRPSHRLNHLGFEISQNDTRLTDDLDIYIYASSVDSKWLGL